MVRTRALIARFRALPASKRLAIYAAAALFCLAGLYVTYKAARLGLRLLTTWQGMRLNQQAWEAGYLERGEPIPKDGPRDGYWGLRLSPHTTHPKYGWVLPPKNYPGQLEIDPSGMQHVQPKAPPRARILILGASTAFGGYASTIEKTYFARTAWLLEAEGLPVAVTVFATGAWKSEQEVLALFPEGLSTKPDIVLFLNGLNDLTNGANAVTRYGVQVPTKDGSRWHAMYHERDFEARVRVYTENMRSAAAKLRAAGIVPVIALQPALFEKKTRSTLEDKVLLQTAAALGPEQEYRSAYAKARQVLADMANQDDLIFLDCSRVFDGETKTVFTDVWHFSDVGHELLGRALKTGLIAPLKRVVR
ncbi:MAG TPA: hypothetical protein DEH78_21010 [Solibacterales bacterium]|nr:hypothetical protein [Bryobacterales bacterium]